MQKQFIFGETSKKIYKYYKGTIMLKFTIQTFVVISLLSHFGYANDYPCTMPAELETWVSFLPDNSPEWIDTGNWSLSYTIPTGLEARFEIISTDLIHIGRLFSLLKLT